MPHYQRQHTCFLTGPLQEGDAAAKHALQKDIKGPNEHWIMAKHKLRQLQLVSCFSGSPASSM